jgi:hypothetical protein
MGMEKYTTTNRVCFSCARNIRLLALNESYSPVSVIIIFLESYDFTAMLVDIFFEVVDGLNYPIYKYITLNYILNRNFLHQEVHVLPYQDVEVSSLSPCSHTAETAQTILDTNSFCVLVPIFTYWIFWKEEDNAYKQVKKSHLLLIQVILRKFKWTCRWKDRYPFWQQFRITTKIYSDYHFSIMILDIIHYIIFIWILWFW